MDLKGKTVLVTGGARRVGRAIALAFAEKGSRLLVHYRGSEKEAAETRSAIETKGADCRLLKGDFAAAGGIESFLDRHGEAVGSASVVVNSASVYTRTPLEEVRRAHWEEFFSVHVLAPFFIARFVGLRLKAARAEGVVINVTDSGLRRPYRHYAPYFASKAALENLTRSLARELEPTVRVNSVAPGAVLFPEAYSEAEKTAVIAQVPLKRAGTPADIAAACVFIAENDYLNGAAFAVDGGRSL